MPFSFYGARKRFVLLKRMSGLSHVDMMAHWATAHAQLISTTPGFRDARRSYIQNHLAEPGPRGDPFPYDGVSQLVLKAPRADSTPFEESPDYKKIKADELTVFDTEASMNLTAIENVVVPGRGACKLMILSRRSPRISSQAYSDHWRTRHVEVILNQHDFRRHIRGYVQNHVIPGSAFFLNGRQAADGIAFDGVIEMWFDSVAAAVAAFGSDGYQRNIRADEPSFISIGCSIAYFVREMVVFDEAAG
jgi:hypothetical protein